MSDCETDGRDFSIRRRSSSTSLTASPSSQKMSLDSDDARSTCSTSGGKMSWRLYASPTDTSNRRPFFSSDLDTNWPSSSVDSVDQVNSLESSQPVGSQVTRKFATPTSLLHTRTPRLADEHMHPYQLPAQSRHHHHRHQQRQHERSASSSSTEGSRRIGPERRSVTRRSSSLHPKTKALTRVLSETEEETRLADVEILREREITQQIKDRLGKMIMDTDNTPSSKATGSVPAAAWARLRDLSVSPSTAPYQCSKLNPEMEMTNFQFDNIPSPMQQAYRSIKRKGSEDRFEPYIGASLKRRAVSPSISGSSSGSPILTGISSPPCGTLFNSNDSSPASSSSGGNAAARAQQKSGQLSTNSFSLQDASGGFSRMSLSE